MNETKGLMEHCAEYVSFHRNTQSITEATLRGYGNKCRAYLRTLDASDGVEAFNPCTVRDYLGRRKTLSPRTYNTVIFALRHFAKYLKAEGVIDADPTWGMELAKAAYTKRTYVPDVYFHAMLTACDNMPHAYRGKLAKAMIACAGFAGMRPHETLDLMPDDIIPSEGKIVVWKGKGRKYREIYPCREFWQIMEEYTDARSKEKEAAPNLFLLNRIKRINAFGYSRLFEQVKAIAGLRDKKFIKPHALRHTCATRLHRNGMAMIDLASFLGHSSVRTTELYLHTGHERLKQLSELGALPPIEQPKVEELKPSLPPNVSVQMQRQMERKRRRIGL